MIKENKENPDLGNRNFMLPSYHKKTFFKGATQLQMQTGAAVMTDDTQLRSEFKLHQRASEAYLE